MSSTEATPLIRGRGSGPRAPPENEEEEDGGGRSRGSQAHRPGTWTSNRVLLTLLGLGVATTAGFISTTQAIERFRHQPSHQQQAGGAAGGGGGGAAAASNINNLARTVDESDEPPSARVSVLLAEEGLAVSAQQQQEDIISSPPADTAAAAAAAATMNAPGSGTTGGRLGGEDQTAAVDSDGGIARGAGEGEARVSGAVLSDGLGARAGGGWRSNGNRKKTGFAEAVEGGGLGELGGGGTGPSVSAGAGSDRKPNVFFILIDDMGYGDIGYQSSDLSSLTPNLDALMSGSRKLSNYYSMSVCTPARASLMTGRYPVRYGMQYSVISPGEPWGLSLSEKVLPEYMNDAGYESHMVGKWHLGSYNDQSIPSQRGFNTFLGYLNGEQEYYSHVDSETMEDGMEFYDFGFGNETGYYDVTKVKDGVPCSEGSGRAAWGEEEEENAMRDPADVCYIGTYSTDAFANRAMEVVKEKTPWDEEPLFLYLAYQSVHSPVGPTPEGAAAGTLESTAAAAAADIPATTTSPTLGGAAGEGSSLAEDLLAAPSHLAANDPVRIKMAAYLEKCMTDGSTPWPWVMEIVLPPSSRAPLEDTGSLAARWLGAARRSSARLDPSPAAPPRVGEVVVAGMSAAAAAVDSSVPAAAPAASSSFSSSSSSSPSAFSPSVSAAPPAAGGANAANELVVAGGVGAPGVVAAWRAFPRPFLDRDPERGMLSPTAGSQFDKPPR